MNDIANTEHKALAAAAATGLVLTVDDEPSINSALRRLLRLHGIASIQATSGAEGLELLEQHAVDLVISDMRMPGMDGAAFLEQVKERQPGILRMLLTGYADINATIAAINRGAIHRYLTKPWDDKELVLAVRDALERRQLEQENERLRQLTEEQNLQLRDLNAGLEKRVSERTSELEQVNNMLEAAYQDLDGTFLATFNVLSGVVDLRLHGSGHSRRVAELSKQTALRLGRPEKEVREIYLAGLVHDIGMISYPDEMLNKVESAYTPDENQRHRRHTLDGETALMSMQNLGGVGRIVRQHHERVDGKGFPDGLAGEAICLGARIVGVASDLDQLLRGRLGDQHYRADDAAQMILSSADTRYDRRIAQAVVDTWTTMQAEASKDVQIDALELKVGMVLARDLQSGTGAVLLACGYVFDEKVVGQVTGYAKRQGARMTLWIRADSIAT